MLISMQSICDWAGTNPTQRKFVKGERVFQAGHIIKCGKNVQNSNSGMVSFTALCLQTSNLKEKPHEINGEVTTSGKIIFCTCSCKAGLGEKCKHIIAALLYCYQKGEALETLSCTDKQCGWKQVHQKALNNYNAAPLLQHQCFLQPSKKIKIIQNATIETNIDIEKSAKVGGTTEVLTCIESSGSSASLKVKEEKHASTSDMKISEIQQLDIKTLITRKLPDSAFVKHISGRHNQITIQEKSKSKTTNIEKEVIRMIFQHQDNEIMQALKQLQVNALQECCENTVNKLSADLEQICVDTKEWFAKWLEERQFRITGSICYNVYTYTKNKNPDWKKKCKNTFMPKAFKTEFTLLCILKWASTASTSCHQMS